MEISKTTFNDMMRELELETIAYKHADFMIKEHLPIFIKYNITEHEYAEHLMGMYNLPHRFLKELYGKNFSKEMLDSLESLLDT